MVAQQVRRGHRGLPDGDVRRGTRSRHGLGSGRLQARAAGADPLLRQARGVFAQLVGEAQFDPAVAVELRDRLVGSRRGLVRAIWDRGVARGELRPDTVPEAAIDVVFGPAMYRLVAGHAPLDEAAADAIVDAAVRGLAP